MTEKTISPNYEHWNATGAGWAAEYDRRKKRMPYYHLQEAMLVSYVAARAPLRVLEYGCGPGRHLRNLSAIPGVEIHGYDQSESMARGCLTWADEAWFETHVHVGGPTGRLPFEDGSFDLVYTSEVLIHVGPGDLAGRLAELRRVARREVLHVEPSPGAVVDPDAHAGCWNHDLVAAWAALGARCELLSRGYTRQSPYRVILDGSAPAWDWPEALLAVYRRMEADLAPGLERLDREEERAAFQEERAEAAEGREAREAQRAVAAERRLEALRARLYAIVGSRG